MTLKKPNILIFGGTTEGKKVTQLFNQINQDYLYSTKNKLQQTVKGESIYGILKAKDISILCKLRNIKLIIDAAHPFAEQLHTNILKAAKENNVETIRFNRKFTDLSNYNNISLFNSFKQLETKLLQSEYKKILALTGVQTISKLEKVWQKKHCVFRILPTSQSRAISNKTNLPESSIIAADPEKNVDSFYKLICNTKAEIVLSKESGETGFFNEKALACKRANIPLWVVKKPVFKGFTYEVNTLMHLQALIYKLRKGLLKQLGPLTHGYTTGSSVTASAKAALLSLLQNKVICTVVVDLPCGENTTFVTYCNVISKTKATCLVIKNAGDDPDITHGEEIGCNIELSKKIGVKIISGIGIGKVTLPGLQVSIGEPAINPVPQKMLTNALTRILEKYEYNGGVIATPFIPKGEELARKTFNPRIGIIGGLSVLGTTGRVEPYSNDAFLESIKKQLQVLKAINCNSVVLTSGLRSENRIKPHLPNLPEQAFVHFGNLVGDTLKLCVELSFNNVYIALMLGKAIKLAEGHLNTHSKKASFNAEFAANIAVQAGCKNEIVNEIKGFKLANAISNAIPFSKNEAFYKLIEEKCKNQCIKATEGIIDVEFFLIYS